MMRWTRWVCLFLLVGAVEPAAAQSLSLGFAWMKTTYGQSAYQSTSGDWQAEGSVGIRVRGPLEAALGASFGKLDEPFSDPSLTSVAVFLEPRARVGWGERFTSVLGARYGWAHERVGERAGGLWAWGWEAGATAELLYALRPSAFLGVKLVGERLDLRRDEDIAPPPLDREGWRFGAGLVLSITPG